MRIGISISSESAATENAVRGCLHLAELAERLGFNSVWLSDQAAPGHFAQGAPPQDACAPEPLTLLSALAHITARVEIGVLALAVPLRHPLMAAKMLSTADRLSGGRVVFGAGTGRTEREFAAAGVAERYAARTAVTDDYLRAIKEAWLNTGPSGYTGEFVRFTEIGTFPHPVRQPHIPIWVGETDPSWLRRAVRLGNGYISFAPDVESFAQHRGEAVRLAEQDRRDPDEITGALAATVAITARPAGPNRALLSGSIDQIVDDLRRLEAAGVQHLIAAVTSEADGSLEARADAIRIAAAEILPAVQAADTGGRP